MFAWISGEAGFYATPLDGGHRITYLDPERSFVVRTCAPLFAVQKGMAVEVRDDREARAKAIFAYNAYLVFRLFLLLFDEKESDEERNETLIDLEQLVADGILVAEAEKKLCSHPLPKYANFELVITSAADFPASRALCERVRNWQPAKQDQPSQAGHLAGHT